MMAPGHVAFGMVSYLGLTSLDGYQPSIFDYIGVVLGSLLPDIDHPGSRVGRTFPTVSNALAKTFGHRGFTHSLIAVVLFMAVIFQSIESMGESQPLSILVAVCIGYLSHVMADFCTVSGVPLLWPYRRRWPNGKEKGYRLPLFHFYTGGKFEYALTTAMALLLAYAWVY